MKSNQRSHTRLWGWENKLVHLEIFGEGNGNPLQCFCLESPRDGGAWWAAISGVAQSWTRLKRLSSSKLLYITKHGVPDGHLVCQPHHQTSPSKLSAVFRSPRIFCLLEPHWEKALATYSSILAWKIPWTEEPGGLQSRGSRRVGHDWATSLSLFTFMHWRRRWQPTPVFLPGESQGWGILVGCRLWGRTESDTTEAT